MAYIGSKFNQMVSVQEGLFVYNTLTDTFVLIRDQRLQQQLQNKEYLTEIDQISVLTKEGIAVSEFENEDVLARFEYNRMM